MSWGGAREGAGRKKAEIPKKYHGIRLTDEEWAFVKEAVKKYRNGEQPQQVAPTQGYSGAGLLAHLEELFHQEYGWLQEYKKYLKNEHYDKHSLEEINLQRELIRLQIVSLLPHLNRFTFDYDVMRECSPTGRAYISASNLSDIGKVIEIKAWQEPDGLDYQEENARLAKLYRELQKERETVRKLERKQNF